MKFSFRKKELVDVLTQVSKAVAVKPMTPVLQGIYLKVFGDVLELQANNYSLGMAGQITVNAYDDGGEAVVIGKKFLEIVKVMPDDVILIARNDKDNCLEISSGRSNYSVATMNADDFPKVTQDDTETRFEINASALKNAIKRTVFACSNDDGGHPLYTGCLFDIGDDKIAVAATNMHRLAVIKDVFLNAPMSARFVIPAGALNVIAGMLTDEDKLIGIYYSGKSVSFSIDGVFVKARLIEGTFPDYNRVIPAETAITANLMTSELRAAIARLLVISQNTKDSKIKFNFARDSVEITAYSAEFGEGKEFLSADVSGGELGICFNSRYINDVLRDFKSEDFQIALNGEFDPALIRDADNYIYVVTPLRA